MFHAAAAEAAVLNQIVQRRREKMNRPCPNCGGTGIVDSGGSEPWGKWINIPCGECDLPYWELIDNNTGKVLFRSRNKIIVAGWHHVIGATIVEKTHERNIENI